MGEAAAVRPRDPQAARPVVIGNFSGKQDPGAVRTPQRIQRVEAAGGVRDPVSGTAIWTHDIDVAIACLIGLVVGDLARRWATAACRGTAPVGVIGWAFDPFASAT